MKTSLVAIAASLALLPTPVAAQDSLPADTPIADDAAPPLQTRFDGAALDIGSAPLNGARLGSGTLRRRALSSSDTAAILASLPGVAANGGGGFSSMPALRGLTEQRIRITLDGIPVDIACPNDMNTPLSYTDPQTVGSIAVVPGVSPVSMGGDNIAGIIAVESAMPRFAVDGGTLVTGEASSFYRSNGDAFGGGVTLTVAGKRISATYSGSYTQSDNYDGGGNRGVVRSTEYAKTDHQLALAAQTRLGLFELKGGYHFSPYEGFPNQYMDMTSNKSWFLNGRYRGTFAWGDVDASVGYRDTAHRMDFLADKQPGSMPMNTQIHSFTSAVKLSLPVGPHDTLRVGGDYQHQGMDDWWPPVAGSMMMGPNPYININDGRRDRLGLFGEWESHWTDRLSTSIGARFDRVRMNTGDVQPYGTGMMNMADAMAAEAFNARSHRRTDNNWSATALASWQASDLLAFELGYAHKSRAPNLYERYAWGRGAMASQMIGWYGDGNGYVGNLDLRSEQADTVSAALRLTAKGGATLKISPYYTRVNDYIDAVHLQDLTDMMGMPSGFVQLQFANQDAEFYGVDVSASVPLQRSAHVETSFTASAAYVHGRNLSDGGPLYRQMPLDLKMGLAHRIDALELGADVEFVADKNRVDATRNEPRTRGYALVDLRAGYTLPLWAKGLKLTVEAKNLFDAGYDLPLGGMSLGDYGATGVLRPVPGMGRSINLGLSTRF